MLRLEPFNSFEFDEAFAIYRQELFEVVEAAFGWDETFQRERFELKYPLDWFHWIKSGEDVLGYVCYSQTVAEIHISFLIIFSDFQRQGFGAKTMGLLHQQAADAGCAVTLSSFKNNLRAIEFYKNLGYQINHEDLYFYDLSRP